MKIIDQFIGIFGAILILILITFILKYFKNKKILKMMNKTDCDTLSLKTFFSTRVFNRFIIERKLKLYKKIFILLLITLIILVVISGVIKYAY